MFRLKIPLALRYGLSLGKSKLSPLSEHLLKSSRVCIAPSPRTVSIGRMGRIVSDEETHILEKMSETSPMASLRKRGLYLDEVYQHANTEVSKLETTKDGKMVNITWGDGHVSHYHSIWLRHNCHCEVCKLDYSSRVIIDFAQIDLKTRVAQAHIEDDCLVVHWQSEEGEKEHTGMLPLAMLRTYCYSDEAHKKRSDERAITYPTDQKIPEIDYSEVSTTTEGLYKWLMALSDVGICLLKNVPTDDGMVATAAEFIAPVRHCIYGKVFEVIDTPQPINPTFSNCHIGYHMDQAHYESPPGLQMLHCLRFDPQVTGGKNKFVDVHEVAEIMRKEKPEYFETLTRVPVIQQTVHYERSYPVHIATQRPILAVNHKNELVSVVWHPTMIGPLVVPSADVEPFYEAYKYFHDKIDSYERCYWLKLTPGDLISFNNRRVLHSRIKFETNGGIRHLQGTYIDISEFHSQVQVFHNKYGDGRLAKRPGSIDWQ